MANHSVRASRVSINLRHVLKGGPVVSSGSHIHDSTTINIEIKPAQAKGYTGGPSSPQYGLFDFNVYTTPFKYGTSYLSTSVDTIRTY